MKVDTREQLKSSEEGTKEGVENRFAFIKKLPLWPQESESFQGGDGRRGISQ